MLGLLKIYILFNLHFILIKCTVSSHANLSVRILDKKIIERKRQDTREMCRIFNAEAHSGHFPNDQTDYSKFSKLKQEIKEKKELNKANKKKTHRRTKRAVGAVYPGQQLNPALKPEDEQRVEKIVDRIYDDLLEKGQNIKYKRKQFPTAETSEKILLANETGRRFPFAPAMIEGPRLTKPPHNKSGEVDTNKLARFRHAIIPYFIDSKTYDTHLTDTIMKAFNYFEKATCIRLQRLRERPTDLQSLQNVIWLYITNPSGIRQCVHSNEMSEIKGVQMIVFGYDCMSLGDITHEIMHVLGFSHEHLRPDRDQYITILWDNIKPGYKKYFEMRPEAVFEDMPYDYASVLHYPSRAFSRNGQVTISTEPGIRVGQREGLSEIDVEKVGIVYSNECVKRNREYLLKTCPSVVRADTTFKPPTQQEIEDYFEDRLWNYGVVNYMLKDKMEFTAEELENINTVIAHIERETCIEFRDLTSQNKNILQEPTSYEAYESSSDEDTSVEKYVQLGLLPNETKPTLPDFSSSEEIQDNFIDTVRKGAKGKEGDNNVDAVRKGAKGKEGDNNVDAVRKGAKGKEGDNNVDAVRKGAKGKEGNNNVDAVRKGAKGKEGDNNVDAVRKGAKGKEGDNNVDAVRKGAKGKEGKVLKKKKKRNGRVGRKPTPPTPSRRHANNILVLSRSPLPGCYCPNPGKPEGTFTMKINADCFNTVNDLLHLFVHVLGLDHQHNMHDRDSYLHIVWDQLTEDVRHEMKRKLPIAASVGFPYDYQSVMHYPWLQIKNGRTNIMYPIWNDGWAMGHWQGLSSTDVQKLNLLYFKKCMERKQQARDDKDSSKSSAE